MYAKFKDFYHFNLLSIHLADLPWDLNKQTAFLLINSGSGPEDIIDGDASDNVLNGTANDDIISGFAGNDTINGNNGNDTIIGGTGDDNMSGGNGDDMFIINAGEHTVGDIYRGNAGTDTIVNDSGAALVFDDFSVFSANNGNSIEFIDMNMQQINGTIGADSLSFSSVILQDLGAGVHIAMLAGNDIVTGSNTQSLTYDLGDGNDTFSSGTTAFNHTVDGGAGNDIISGNNGNDILTGGAGVDQVNGGAGDDMLIIGVGDHDILDIYRGNSGTDTLVNNTGGALVFDDFNIGSANNGNSIENIDLNGEQLSGTAGVDSLTFTTVTLLNLSAGTDIATLAGNDGVTGSNTQSLTYDLGDGDDTFSSGTTTNAHTVDGGAGNDSLNGNNGDDVLTGGAGVDQVNGGAGDDMLIIGAGDHDILDIYRGGSGIDTLVNNANEALVFDDFNIGSANNGNGIENIDLNGEQLSGTAGVDSLTFTTVTLLNLSAGTDIATLAGNDGVTGSNTQSLTYDLGDGDDTFSSGTTTNAHTVDGGAGNDSLNGNNGDDVLTGGAGIDTINGNAGDDTLIIGASDHDILDIYRGGSGTDTLINNSSVALVFDDFAVGSANNGNGIEFIDMNLQQIHGTALADSLNFTSVTLQDLMAGLHIMTLDGNDVVTGSNTQSLSYDLGDGDDTFNSGTTAFNHTVDGGAGDDSLNGNNGDDIFTAGVGTDTVNAGGGDDMIIVGVGHNNILDIYRGQGGSDTLVNDSGTALLFDDWSFSSSNNGNTIEFIDMNFQQIHGTAGNDSLNFVSVTLLDLAGGTHISTFAGADSVTGSNTQALTYDLGDDNDTFTGNGSGADTVDGGAGNDILNGNDGNDILTAGLGDDQVNGGNGDDTIIVGVGHNNVFDVYRGQAGIDTLVNNSGVALLFDDWSFTSGNNGNTIENIDMNFQQIHGTAGGDVLNFSGNTFIDLASGTHVSTFAGVDGVTGAATQSLTYDLGADNDFFTGTAISADIVLGGDGNDNINTGGGDDFIEGGAGGDAINGGVGIDTASYASSDAAVMIDLLAGTEAGGHAAGDNLISIENLIGSAFNDTLTGNASDNVLEAGDGDDTLDGGAGNDTASYAGAGAGVTVNLTLVGPQDTIGAGIDTLTSIENLIGSAFDDTLTGDANDNSLSGGAGDDLLAGLAGMDALDGGAGMDTADYSVSAAGVTVDLALGTGLGGDAAGDTLTAIENLIGSALADTLTGDAGDNVIEGGDSGDTISGGLGIDTASYSSSDAAVQVNLGAATATGGHAAGDTLTSIENLIGSAFGDVLTGDANANVLDGGDGNDILIGGSGDTLLGNGGNDIHRFDSVGVYTNMILDGGAGSDDIQMREFDGVVDLSDASNVFVGIEEIDYSHSTIGGTAHLIVAGEDVDEATEVASNLLLDSDAGEIDIFEVFMGAITTLNISTWTFSNWSNTQDQLIIVGDGDAETITGSTQADTINGNGGDDVLSGDDGDDVLDGGAGADTLNGNDDVDTLTGGDGNDMLFGGGHVDTLYGGAGNDTLDGGTSGDQLFGGDGDDTILAGNGGDTIHGDAGADNIDGGSSSDLLTFVASSAAVNVNLLTGMGTGGDAQGDTYANIENLIGSAFADVLTGTNGVNTINVGDGDDVFGNDGNDVLQFTTAGVFTGVTLDGGAGSDDVQLSEFTGTLDLSDASNSMTGIEEIDYSHSTIGGTLELIISGTMAAAAGALFVDSDLDELDIFQIVMGSVTTLDVSSWTFQHWDAGADDHFIINGDADAETITGSIIGDTINGNDGDDFIEGGAGADALDGGAGNDTASYAGSAIGVTVDLTGGTGLGGDAEGDTLSGFENILGSAFADTLTGDSAANILTGSEGGDTINGGAGDDMIFGGNGADIIDGGEGVDTIDGGTARDIIDGGAGDDIIDGGTGKDVLHGGDGNDTLNGGNQADVVKGGNGEDSLFGDGGDDLLFGQGSNDTLSGGFGNDTLDGGGAADILNGDAGDDILLGQAGNDDLFGGNGVDTLFGGTGRDMLDGGIADDMLYGGAERDFLFGGGGSDVLDGGAGDDRLTGGTGLDTFVFTDDFGTDVITDFFDAVEKIDLSGHSGFTDFADVTAAAFQFGGAVVLYLDDDNVLAIQNFDLSDLTADDFIF